MSGPTDRRGFLRGLATLPLIGGGVALIGSPTGAAEPVTERPLDSYDAWLFYERRYLRFERFGQRLEGPAERAKPSDLTATTIEGVFDVGRIDFVRTDNAGGAFHCAPLACSPPPSSRAAVVLSTVGCDWKRTR